MKTISVYNAYQRENGSVFCGKIGQVICPEDIEPSPETIWHLTNHGCWNQDDDSIIADNCGYKPNGNDRGFTNDDIFFQLGDTWYAAKMCGWEKLSSFDEAKAFILENALWLH